VAAPFLFHGLSGLVSTGAISQQSFDEYNELGKTSDHNIGRPEQASEREVMDKMLSFDCNGVHLKTSTFGDPSHPIILFLHATCQSRWTWNAAARWAAERGFFAVTPDLRGHGTSSWAPDGDYSPRAYADDVVAMLDQLKRPVTIIGHSLGGWVGLAGGALRPDRIRLIVSFDAAPPMKGPGRENFYDFYDIAAKGFETLEAAAREVETRFGLKITDIKRFRHRFTKRDGRLFFPWDPKVERVHKVSDQYQDWLLGLLEGFPRPTVLMLAEHESMVGNEAVQAMHARIPLLIIEKLQGTRHAMPTADSVRVTARTLFHLQRLKQSPAT
jgi:pimeloyl-ACP methyl ester carboxylesterase